MSPWQVLAAAALIAGGVFLTWRRGQPGVLAHELPWAGMVADGVVLNKAGSLMAAWRLFPRDLAMTEESVRQVIAATAHRALQGLDERWMWHVDVIRRRGATYGEGSEFPDAATALLDSERRAAFGGGERLLETVFVLSVTWAPPAKVESFAERWFVSGGRSRERQLEEQVHRFESRVGALVQSLAAAVRLERLASAELAGHLRECVTGLCGPVKLPDPPYYLDAYLSLPDVEVGHEPKVGLESLTVLSIDHDGLPPQSEPALFRFLVDLPVEFRWSLRWLPLSRSAAEREAHRAELRWYKGRQSFQGQLTQYSKDAEKKAFLEKTSSRGALTMAEDASKVSALIHSGLVGGGYASIALFVREADPGRREQLVRTIERKLVAHGFGARRETDGAFEVWLGSMPGNSTENVRWPFVHTVNLAHFLPLHAPYLGEKGPESPFLAADAPPLLGAWTEGGSAFRGSLHIEGVPHAMVVGPTGKGKSVLLGFIAASWLRYPGAQVFYFDKGASQLALSRAAGGVWSELTADAASSAAPLLRVDEPAERDWALDWLLEICRVARPEPVTVRERERLARALEHLARAPREDRTMTGLMPLVQDLELRRLLSAYAWPTDGSSPTMAQAILDGSADTFVRSHLHVFELEQLLGRGPETVVPVLRYLFHRIERELDPKRPTLIVVDEAWAALGYGSDGSTAGRFARQIVEWALTLRKHNGALVLATQNLQHLSALPEVEAMRENLPTWVYLPNEKATSPAVAPQYAALGLNALEREAIATARSQRQYFWKNDRGGQLIDLALGKVGLALLASQPQNRHIETLRSANPNGWFGEWLRERGAHDEAAEYLLSVALRQKGAEA